VLTINACTHFGEASKRHRWRRYWAHKKGFVLLRDITFNCSMTASPELVRGWIVRSKHSGAAMAGTDKKVAVITGASQGIGAALVKAYRDRDYRVVATARSVKPSSDADVHVVPGDIADWKTAERALPAYLRMSVLPQKADIT